MSSTWRKYGGQKNSELQNTINTTYLSTENFNMEEPFRGIFRIDGDLSASNILINNAIVISDVNVQGNVISDNLSIINITAQGNLYVKQNEYLTKKLYMDVSNNFGNSAFFIGNATNVGLNVDIPTATLDICGNNSQVLKVFSSQENTRNVIAQNGNHHGIAVSANSVSSQVQFFSNGNNVDSFIQYSTDGKMIVDVPNNTTITSNVSIRGYDHLLNEFFVIYGENTDVLLPNIYFNDNAGTGNTLTLVAGNNTSTTYMHIVTPSGEGLSIGGGMYPKDTSRTTGFIGFDKITPSQVLVAGNNIGKNESTIGFNTYAPRTEEYVLDINGPVHIGHGEITQTFTTDFEVKAVGEYSNSVLFMAGSSSNYEPNPEPEPTYIYKLAKSYDTGKTWETINITGDFNNSKNNYFYGIDIDGTYSVIAGTVSYYTINYGNTWYQFDVSPLLPTGSKNILDVMIAHDISCTFFLTNNVIGYIDSSGLIDFPNTGGDIASPLYFNGSNNTLINSKKMSSLINGNVFIVGSSGIRYFKLSDSSVTNVASGNYSDISIYGNNIIAVGYNNIAYSKNGGVSFTVVPLSIDNNLNSIYIYDFTRALAVGDNATILYSVDGYNTWNPIPPLILNAGGTMDTLLQGDFTDIKSVDTERGIFVITTRINNFSNTSLGKSYTFYCYLPALFGRSKVLIFAEIL